MLIGEFSEDTAQDHYSGQVSGEFVRNCQKITDIGVSVTSSVRIIWLVSDFSHELFTTGWCLFVCPPPVLYNEWEEVDESWQPPVTTLAKVKLFRQVWPEATPE